MKSKKKVKSKTALKNNIKVSHDGGRYWGGRDRIML